MLSDIYDHMLSHCYIWPEELRDPRPMEYYHTLHMTCFGDGVPKLGHFRSWRTGHEQIKKMPLCVQEAFNIWLDAYIVGMGPLINTTWT